MKKNKGYTKEFRSDDPSTYLTNVDQQKAMLLDTIDDAKAKPKKKVMEPIEIPEVLSVPRTRLTKKTEVIESNTGPETVGLSRRFTQDKMREEQILKQLDKELADERDREDTLNKRGTKYI